MKEVRSKDHRNLEKLSLKSSIVTKSHLVHLDILITNNISVPIFDDTDNDILSSESVDDK